MEVARTLRNDREKMGEQPMYRPSRGHGQSQSQTQQAAGGVRTRRNEDPLAELARLIGQEDPFKEFDTVQPRRAAAANPNGNGAAQPPMPRPERRPERLANGGTNAAANGLSQRPANREANFDTPRQPASRYAQSQPASAPQSRIPARADERTAPARPTRAPLQQARTSAPAYDDNASQPQSRLNGRDPNARYADRPVARSRDEYPSDQRRALRQPSAEQPAARRPDRYEPEEAPRQARSRQPVQNYRDQRSYENDYDPEYADDAYLPEHADDIYDDVQKPLRGWGFWLVAAIVLVSLIAVAFLGVFAYRTVFNSPPRAAVVTKSNTPTKVEPQKATPQNAAAPNKTIQDRIGGVTETQTLKREEQPVDLTQPNQQTVPDAARPQQPAAQRTPAFSPPPQQQQQVPQNADQPKRVKTMTIRSDGTVQQNNPAQAPQNNAPLPLNANPEPDTQTLPPQTRPNSAIPQQPNRTVTASLTPSAPPAHQQQQATAPASGNYVVQVASHKTQEEAQAAWQALRQQYGSIFGSRNADIRRVDLGDRGTFYRAMVGPMNREQANALCQNLKTQGAGCIVQTR